MAPTLLYSERVSQESSFDTQYRSFSATFGSGYKQRIKAGPLDKDIQSTFVISGLDHSELALLETQLDSLGTHSAFSYTIPSESTPRLWCIVPGSGSISKRNRGGEYWDVMLKVEMSQTE